MIRWLVVSDSHGNARALCRALDEQPTACAVFHLGDGAAEAEQLRATCPCPLYTVAGNCDFSSPLPSENEVRIHGVPVFYTHGHRYGVKAGTGRLEAEARRRGVRVALFGHTHQPTVRYENGLYLVNPGSLGYSGSYAIIDVVGSELSVNLTHLR